MPRPNRRAGRPAPSLGGRTATKLALTLIAAATLFCTAEAAQAHQVGLSRGVYRVVGEDLQSTLTLAFDDVSYVLSQRNALRRTAANDSANVGNSAADQPDADTVAARTAWLRLRRSDLLDDVIGGVAVTADDRPCAARLDDVQVIGADGVTLTATHHCESTSYRALVLRFDLLEKLPYGHRHVVALDAGRGQQLERVVHRSDKSVELLPSTATEGSACSAPSSPSNADHRPTRPSVASYFVLGIEHILTGYDHLVFLLALILAGGAIRSLLLAISAFTVAHSITLACAALGLVQVNPAWVEPIIALSVAYVGLENLVFKRRGTANQHRWRITFAFGLIHGFGFAGALRSIGLPDDHVPAALAVFNLGVEAGQLAVVAAVIPVLARVRRWSWFSSHGTRYVSVGVLTAGLLWFVQRVVEA